MFYEKTARPLWGYLARMTRNPSAADDLLQDSYIKLLKADLPEEMTAEHRKNYLFRIATNLTRDLMRKAPLDELGEVALKDDVSARVAGRRDVGKALEQLRPRERQMLWLAYVEKFSHEEIADAMGGKAQSVRPLLHRARHKLASLLKGYGYGTADL